MRIAKWTAGLGAAAMAAILGYAALQGDFAVDGAALLRNPWGLVSIVDLYVGFILFALWISYRERGILRKLVWIALLMGLGFFAGSLYVLQALISSRGDWQTFWMGRHAPG